MLDLFIYITILLSNPQISSTVGSALVAQSENVLGNHSFSLQKRYDNQFVNDVFKDNILLTIKYMEGSVTKKEDINWEDVQKPFKYEFTLNPNEGFAFHDQILPEYKDFIVKTTNAHFNYQDGFKSSGALYGDGVCHLASLIYWAAKDAGLNATSLVNHNFAKINEVPKEFGVSIKTVPGQFANSSRQNLYIINNKDTAIRFVFENDGEKLTVKVVSSTKAVA